MAQSFTDGPAPTPDHIKAICPNVFLVCFRNKNRNVVVYQARVENGVLLDPPIEAYWLILEPSYQDARKAQGIYHDREELGFIDYKFAWGFEQKRISDTQATFMFNNFSHPMTIKINEKGAQAFANKDDRKYLIRSLFVKGSDNIKLFNIRDNVKSISLNALDITEKPYQPKTVYLKGGE